MEYEFEKDIIVKSRQDEGLVTCRVEDYKNKEIPPKKTSIYLYVASKYCWFFVSMLQRSIILLLRQVEEGRGACHLQGGGLQEQEDTSEED